MSHLLDKLDVALGGEYRLTDGRVFWTALHLAEQALAHDVPGSCWATGPLTGGPIEDLIVCPGCRALHAIRAALARADRSEQRRA